MSLVRAGFVEIPPSSFASDRLEHLEAVETERGAPTTGSDPDSRCLYVFNPKSSGAAVFKERS